MDAATHEIFYDKLSFIYLEISQFKKTEEELETHFDKWLYVLKNLHQLDGMPNKLRDEIFIKLFNQAKIANLTKREMRAYEESQKAYWDNHSVMESAKKMARQEGILDVARELKRNNVAIELIAKSTGLTLEQIEEL